MKEISAMEYKSGQLQRYIYQEYIWKLRHRLAFYTNFTEQEVAFNLILSQKVHFPLAAHIWKKKNPIITDMLNRKNIYVTESAFSWTGEHNS